MTVSPLNGKPEIHHKKNNSNKYTIPFPYAGKENLGVYISVPDDAARKLILGSDYSIEDQNGKFNNFGELSLLPHWMNKNFTDLVISREIPLSQESTFYSQTMYGKVTENALDKLTMIVQDFESSTVITPKLLGGEAIHVQPIPNSNNAVISVQYDDRTLRVNNQNQLVADIGGDSYTAGDGIEIAMKATVQHIQNVGYFNAVTYADNKFVAVGTGGAIYHSENGGVTWTPAENTGTLTFLAVTYAADKFVAVGNEGKIYHSEHGETWTPAEGETGTHTFSAVTYADNKFVAVGTGGAIYHSENGGVTWTKAENTGTLTFLAVTYAADKFVAVGDGGAIYHSENGGVTWTPAENTGTLTFSAVTYGNAKFVAVGEDGKIYHSENGGVTWTKAENTGTLTFYAVTYAADKFVAVGEDGKIYYSTDGETWDPATFAAGAPTSHFLAVTYAAGKFVAVGGGSNIYYSTDGVTWTPARFEGTPPQSHFYAVTYADNKFVAVGTVGTIALIDDVISAKVDGTTITVDGTGIKGNYTAGNGIEIENGSNVVSAKVDGTTITFDGYGALSATGGSYTAGNGIEINGNAISAKAGNNTVTVDAAGIKGNYQAGTNVDITNNTISSTDTTYTAGDGIEINGNAISAKTATTSTLGVVKPDGSSITVTTDGMIAAIGGGVGSYTAGDGIEIAMKAALQQIENVGYFRTVTYAAGKFVAVGAEGTIYHSENGDTNWTAATFPAGAPTSNFWAVTYAANKFVAVGDGGVIYHSEHGITWTAAEGNTGTHTFSAVTYADNKFVAVGAGGAIYHSENGGVTWTPAENTGTLTFLAVTYAADKFVAVGNEGKIYHSTDGETWDPASFVGTPTSNFRAVTYGNAKFVAVGEDGKIYHSDDGGVTWTKAENTGTLTFYAVTYAADKFVAVGEDGKIYYSTDGETWDPASFPDGATTSDFLAVTYAAGKFVAVGGGSNIYYSTDGDTWTKATGTGTDNFLAVTFGAGKFVAVGGEGTIALIVDTISAKVDGTTITVDGTGIKGNYQGGNGIEINGNAISAKTATTGTLGVVKPDGSSITITTGGVISATGGSYTAGDGIEISMKATLQHIENVGYFHTVTYAAGKFVAVGYEGKIYHSDDGGRIWTPATFEGTPPTSAFLAVTYADNKFVAVGSGGAIYHSENGGVTWTKATGYAGTDNFYAVTYADSKFVAVGNAGAIYHSENGGVTWTKATGTTGTNHLWDVTYAAGKFVVVGGIGEIYYSEHGITWTKAEGNTGTNTFSAVTYGNDKFVAVGSYGVIFHSENGITGWTQAANTGTDIFRAVTYAAGKFVAVGDTGKIYYSTDGATGWNPATFEGTAPTSNFNAVTFGANKFVAVGYGGAIYHSENGGVTWTKATGTGTDNFLAVTYADNKFVAVGYGGVIYISYSIDIDTISAKAGNNTITVDAAGIKGNYTAGNGIEINENAISAIGKTNISLGYNYNYTAKKILVAKKANALNTGAVKPDNKTIVIDKGTISAIPYVAGTGIKIERKLVGHTMLARNNTGSFQWGAYGEGAFHVGLDKNHVAKIHGLNPYAPLNKPSPPFYYTNESVWKYPFFTPNYVDYLEQEEIVTAICWQRECWVLGTNLGRILKGFSMKPSSGGVWQIIKEKNNMPIHKMVCSYGGQYVYAAAADGVYNVTASFLSHLIVGTQDQNFIDIAFDGRRSHCLALADNGQIASVCGGSLLQLLNPESEVVGAKFIVNSRKNQWIAALKTEEHETQLAVIYPTRRGDKPPYYDINWVPSEDGEFRGKLPDFDAVCDGMFSIEGGFVVILNDGSIYYWLDRKKWAPWQMEEADFSVLGSNMIVSDNNKILCFDNNNCRVLFLANVVSLA